MNPANDILALLRLRAGHPDDMVERFGGYLVAFAIGLVTFTWMATTVIRLPAAAIPTPAIKIVLRPEPQTPDVPPVPTDQQADELTFEEIAATAINANEEAPLRDSMDGAELAALLPEDIRPPSLSQWTPNSPDAQRRVEALRQSVADYRDRLEIHETGVQAEINRLAIESAGRRFLLNTDGGRTGIIRTLDMADFPLHIVRPILERYGITIEYKHVNPEETRRGFLNAATTAEGTFTTVAREGYYEVFVLSAKAVSMMAAKEVTALQARGYEPGRARIRKVQFGIIKNKDDEFDLDVVEMEVERVR